MCFIKKGILFEVKLLTKVSGKLLSNSSHHLTFLKRTKIMDCKILKIFKKTDDDDKDKANLVIFLCLPFNQSIHTKIKKKACVFNLDSHN
jgi:hypothetical protein